MIDFSKPGGAASPKPAQTQAPTQALSKKVEFPGTTIMNISIVLTCFSVILLFVVRYYPIPRSIQLGRTCSVPL